MSTTAGTPSTSPKAAKPAKAASIIEFLEARIAEEEDVARLYDEHHHPTYIYADGALGTPDGEWDDGSPHLPNRHTDYAVLYDPARALAECAAKRAVIAQAEVASGLDMDLDSEFRLEARDEESEPYCGDVILRVLAGVYRDHPDYRQEWAIGG